MVPLTISPPWEPHPLKRVLESQVVAGLFHEWRPREAEVEFDRTLSLSPDDALPLGWKVLLLAFTGRKTEALATARRAIASEPLSQLNPTTLGEVLVTTEQFGAAIEAFEPALEIWPDGAHLRQWLGLAHRYVDRPEDAEAQYRAASELVGHLPLFDAYWGASLARLGRGAEARAVLEELQTRSRQEEVGPYARFVLTLALDGWETGVPCLEQMVGVRSFLRPYVLSAARFPPFHQNPRFRSLYERVFPGVRVGGR